MKLKNKITILYNELDGLKLPLARLIASVLSFILASIAPLFIFLGFELVGFAFISLSVIFVSIINGLSAFKSLKIFRQLLN
jgi:hypothetical protein